MSNQLSLESRTVQGKKLKALRAAGQIPSVVYGLEQPLLTTSSYNPTEKALLEAGYHSPVELLIAGKPQLAIVKSITTDPVNRRIMNVEFQAVSADEVVVATTPIKITNFDKSEAAKLHYVLMPVIEEVDIKAKPASLPEELIIDGSKLATTENRITIADIVLPAGVELADKELDKSTVIANVMDPVAEAAARENDDQQTENNEAEVASTEKAE